MWNSLSYGSLDLLLVDEGFTVQDLLYEEQATIRITAFFGNRPRLKEEEEMETKLIAKAHIHIERLNEQLNKFLLVVRKISLSYAQIASQAVYVACCLLNFQQPLCKEVDVLVFKLLFFPICQ